MEVSSLEVLPDLTDEYSLSAEQIAGYGRDGHICLRAVASTDEVAAYRTRIRVAVARYNTQTDSLDEPDESGARPFIQVENLWERDDEVRRFVFASRFAKIAADLMGVDRVRLLYDQALFKQSGGKPTDWHQDGVFFPALDPAKIVSMWIPLVPVRRSLSFMSGIHERGDLQAPYGIDQQTEEYFNGFLAETGARVRHYGTMAPGDVTLHDSWTPHRAVAHASEEPTTREVMTMIYFADGAHVIDPRTAGLREVEAIEDEMATFGWQPGDLAEGPVAPLLYERPLESAGS